MEEVNKTEISPKRIQSPKKKRRMRLVYSAEKKPRAKCTYCGLNLNKGALVSHYRAYHGNEAFQCKICEKVFVRITNVKNHIKKIHVGMDQEMFLKCRKEDLPQHALEDLEYRLRSAPHSTAPPTLFNKLSKINKFNCYDCDGSFPSVKELFTHCETHRVSPTGEKFPYLVKTTKRWSKFTNRWVFK